MEWHQKNVPDVIKELGTDPLKGLSSSEAALRRARWGLNTLVEKKRASLLSRAVRQFKGFIILVLIGAAVISGLLGEWVDSIAIIAIVLLNGIIGFIQEEKAEEAMAALKKLSAPAAKAVRDGALSVIPASLLVPGDIVVLESGDHIPADCRIIESSFLKVSEAALTGESHPIEKETGGLAEHLPIADRTNMAYLGANVVYGKGRAAVTATGMSTEMGKIARMLQEARPEATPLQRRLEEFARRLVYAALAVCGLIFILGISRGEDFLEMFLTAVSLAVAAVPEGLAAVVTIVLAIGVQRMARRHALIRTLPSVETLGSATVIASDKTGTLTRNEMTVKKLYLAGGRTITVSGAGYSPEGGFFTGPGEAPEIDPRMEPPLLLALKAGLLCNTAELKRKDNGGYEVIGDPTEGALITLGLKAGLKKNDLEKDLRFLGEAPFDPARKMMSAVYAQDMTFHIFVKGASESVLVRCASILDGEGLRPMTPAEMDGISRATDELSKDAMRVIALAYRLSYVPLDLHSPLSIEKDLVFLALAGMIDPPREEAFSAVQKAAAAGITPIMITGDHKMTAVAVAKELNIFREGDIAVTGEELDGMSGAEFSDILHRIKVYARVNPEHKLRVVKAWKEKGEVIAMTGDGVNDAPALKEADIGVAMGMTGTDVTKGSSDMILTDDNFASIVSAVEEGRGIFDNIRRVVHYLLSCNVGEVLVLLIASLAGMPLPLHPVQILWMNLVTDGLPALGLAMEPIDPGIMERRPRRKGEGIVTGWLLFAMLLQGVFISACTLAVYGIELYWLKGTVDEARTMAFMVIIFCQMFHVYNCRSAWKSVFSIGVFSNRMLNITVIAILAGQFLLIHVPALRMIFKVTYPGVTDWAIIFAASVQPLVLMEVVKKVWPRRG